MSIWTPDGEHEVPPDQPSGGTEPTFDDLSDEQKQQAAEIAEEMAEARKRIAEAPAAVVVLNHVMGFYELGAIHLSTEPPNLVEAKVAIDAMASVVSGLEGRLGDEEATVRDALTQIQMAYVQLSDAAEEAE